MSGRIDPVGNYPLAAQLEWQWRQSALGVLSARGRYPAISDTLVLRHEIDGFIDAELRGRLERVLSAPAWSLDVRLAAVNLGHRVAELAGTTLSGTLESEGSVSTYTARANLTALPAAGPGPLDLSLALVGSPDSIELESLRLTSKDTPLSLMASGELQPETLQVRVQGSWQEVPWPLAGEPQVVARSGEVRVEGTAQAYRGDLKGEIFTPHSGLVRLQTQVSGSDRSALVDALHLQVPATGTQAQARGGVSFADLSFDLDVGWQDALYPLVGVVQVRSAHGSLQIHGTPADYGFELRTALAGDAVPSGDWLAEGRGTQTEVSLTRLGGVTLRRQRTRSGYGAVEPDADLGSAATGR